MIRRNWMNNLGLGFSLLGLAACGNFPGQSGSNKDKAYRPYALTNARLEAQRLAAIQPELRQGMAYYESCETLTADLNDSIQKSWVQQRASISDSVASMLNPSPTMEQNEPIMADSAAPKSAPETAGTASAETMTNVQEAGVDEADRYRIGRDQIYAHSFGQIQIMDRSTLKLQGSLDVSSWSSPQFYTRDDRLIVVGQMVWDSSEAGGGKVIPGEAESDVAVGSPFPGPNSPGKVKIAVYKTVAGQLPSLLTESTVVGTYHDSRLVQNQLVLVIGDQIEMETVPVTLEDFVDEAWYKDPRAAQAFANVWARKWREVNVKIVDQTVNGIACQSFVKRRMADWDHGVSKVLTLDTANPGAPAQNLGVIGQSGEIYMTTDSLFLLKTSVQWFDERWNGWTWAGRSDEKLLIQQIGFNGTTGALNPLAEGEVRGRIKDRWALHGMNGGNHLAVATTTGSLWASGEDVAQNHLYILESDPLVQRLNVVGQVENFGTNEDIRSVRYIGNTAYVVTFRQTDPLFAIDITDAKAPAMLSGLKVPGFSTYMHPLAPGRLLGVGFDAFETGQVQGVQVSLFDTNDPTLMSRLDVKTYGNRGSNSDVTQDHHAFFYDAASGLIGLPLVDLHMYGEVKFSGAQLLVFDGNALVDRGRVSHRELIPPFCQSQMGYGRSLDINRLYRVDDRLITLSAYGMKAYSLSDFAVPLTTVPFKAPVGECHGSHPMPL